MHYLYRQSGRSVHMPVVKRGVLENIEVPLPELEIQKKIVQTVTLLEREQELLKKLAAKRKKLITEICLKVIHSKE